MTTDYIISTSQCTDSYEKLKNAHHLMEDAVLKHISLYENSIQAIGISTAGNITPSGVIERWGHEYHIINRLHTVYSCNDGEAHMLYCTAQYNICFPALCIVLGTGVAIAVTNDEGDIVRTSNQHFNLDNVILHKYRGISYNVHDILGYAGLKKYGQKKYMAFLWKFILMFGSFFNVKTVFLGGGNITDMDIKIDAPYNIVLIPKHAALIGLLSKI